MVIHAFLYKQNVHKQRQAEIGKKIKQKLSKTPRLNFCYLKIIFLSLFTLSSKDNRRYS